MEFKKKLIKKPPYYVYMICTFLITFVFQFAKLCTVSNISLISDNIGQLAIASHLAGLDWQGAISQASYYGWGYNFIFAFLFKITSNPYTIYYAIRIFNITTISLTSILIYRFSEKMLNTNNKILSCMCSIFISVQASIEWGTEGSVFISVWITVILLAYLFEINRKSKRSRCLSFILGLWLCYSLTLHERNMALLFAVIIMYLFFYLFNKRKIFDIVPFVISMIIFFPMEQALKNLVIEILWPAKDDVLKNVTVFNGNQFWFIEDLFEGFKIIVGTIVANFYTLMNRTYGLFAICFTIFLREFFCFFKDTWYQKKKVNLSLNHFCLLFSFIATSIVILGIAIQWGRGISVQNFYSYKGLTYYRYYLPYFWPAVLITCNWIYKEKCFGQIFDWALSLVTFGFLSYMFVFVMKEKILFAQGMESRDLKLENAWIQVFSDSEFAYVFSFAIGLFFIMLLCTHWKYCVHTFAILAGLLTIAGYVQLDQISLPKATCSSAGSAYEVFSTLSGEDLPDEIYSMKTNYTLQYMLNRYTIIYDLSQIHENEHIIFDVNYEYNKFGSDYKGYILDDNECIYVHGERLMKIFDEKLN